MFDSVLGRGVGPKSRFGTGAVLSVLLHIGLVAVAVWLSTRPVTADEADVEVTFKQAMAPPPPPPPPPPPKSSSSKTKKKPTKKPDTIVKPKEIPTEKPPETEPVEEEESASEEEVAGGVEGGV